MKTSILRTQDVICVKNEGYTDFFVPIDLPQSIREKLHLDTSLIK